MNLPQSLPALFYSVCKSPDTFSWHYKKNGAWLTFSNQELLFRLKNIYFAFKNSGISKGMNIALMLKNSPDWILCDLAIQLCGAITVPFFPNLAEENFLYQKQDSNIDFLILESEEFIDFDLREKLSLFARIIQLEKTDLVRQNTLFLEDLIALNTNMDSNEKTSEFEQAIDSILTNSLFSIIYTSGSTGFPKGVELTHENMLSQFESLQEVVSLSQKDKALSILPLAHIFERMTIYFLLSCKTSIYFGDDPKQLAILLKDSTPSLITVVPRLLERVYEKIQKLTITTPYPKKFLLKKAIRWAQTHDPQKPTNFLGKIYDSLIFSKIRTLFGNNLSYVISGSSALNKNVCRFFLNAGIPIYEGYGMTECSPVITLNAEEKGRPGSVGLPLKHLELKLSPENEILVKGKSVFKGYHNLHDKNNLFFTEDGFFRTGDQGFLGENGQLYLTGRIKEMLKTSTGKYVSPTPIEDDLCKSSLITSACIIANNRKYVSALLFLNPEAAMDFLKIPKEEFQIEKALQSKRINESLKKLIQKTNHHLNHWEQIRRWVLLPDTLSAESGLLTPTLKVRRREIEKQFIEEINSLYLE